MANSFGDQFLKAGLVNKTQLNKAKKSKSRQQKLKDKQKVEVVDEAALAARQAAAEKAARDRELNRRQKEEAERLAVHLPTGVVRLVRERAVVLLTDADRVQAEEIFERLRGDFAARFGSSMEFEVALGYFQVIAEPVSTWVQEILERLP